MRNRPKGAGWDPDELKRMRDDCDRHGVILEALKRHEAILNSPYNGFQLCLGTTAEGLKTLLAIFLTGALATAQPGATLNCDLSQYQRLPGLEARVDEDALLIRWNGESGQQLRAEFAIEKEAAVIRELAVRKKDGEWSVLGRNLAPEFGVTTGVRRTNHGLPEEKRWDVFWDVPLNHTNEVRRFTASYHVNR